MRVKKTRFVVLLILSVLLIYNIWFFTELIDNKREFYGNNSPKLSVEYSPIHIDGNGAQNWAWAVSQPWCTYNNGMYIIENISINGGNSDNCIFIEDSSVYFRIKNCTFYNSNRGSYPSYNGGIKLYNVQNAQIVENNCSDNVGAGIFLDQYCMNLTIVNNTIERNDYRGIYLNRYNDGNIITDNNINDNGYSGIFLYMYNDNNNITDNIANNNAWYGIRLYESCYYTTITGNDMSGGGIVLNENGELSQLTSTTVDLTNTVNGKIIYCYINENQLTSANFLNPGQIILISCSNSTLSNLILSFASRPVTLYYCDSNTISSNDFSFNFNDGLVLWGCYNNTITNNTANNNDNDGIYLRDSYNNTISDNNFMYNDYGVSFRSSNDNRIIRNNASFNSRGGMEIWMSDDNKIIGNNASYNDDYAIRLRTSDNCDILDNIVGNNDEYGIYLYDSSYSNTLRNNMMQGDGMMVDESYNNDIDTSNLVNGKPIYYYDGFNGATINGVENAGQLIISNCHNSEFSNWNISDISDGIILTSSNDNNLTNCNSTNNKFHGIRVLRSDRNVISNNVLLDNGEPWAEINYHLAGIYMDYSSNNVVTKNFFIHNTKGIDLYYAYNNIITNNNFFYNYIGIHFFHADNSDIFDNTMSYNRYAIYLIGTANHEVSNNIITHSDIGIELNGASDSDIYGNDILFSDNSSNNCGLYMRYSDRNEIFNNNISYSARFGLYMRDSDDNTIRNNTISHTNEYDGILMWTAHGNDFINNIITNNSDNGIYCYDSDNNEFISNNASYNDNNGLYFLPGSNNNIVWSNNTFSNNIGMDITGAPTIDYPADQQYEFGTTGHNITWIPNVRDITPNSYIITRNGAVINDTTWDGSDISINIDGLSVGTYIYICTVYGTNGNAARDSVNITVIDTISPTIDEPEDIVYEHGTTGHNIIWSPYDSNPDSYSVAIGGVVPPTIPWNGSDIIENIDGLAVGSHEFWCLVVDGGGNNAWDTVIVTIEDNIAPTISDQENFGYEYGTTGYNITWSPYDSNPDYYVITRNGEIIINETWNGDNISINIDGLSVGNHTFICTVYDGVGHSVLDTVVVTVFKDPEPSVPIQFYYLTAGGIVIASLLILQFRHSKIRKKKLITDKHL